MLQHAQTYLFDFDGTLAPNLDLPDMRRQVIGMTAAQGVPAHVYQDHYIVEIITVAGRWLARHNTAAATEYMARTNDLILTIELNAAAETQLFDQTRGVLAHLKSTGDPRAFGRGEMFDKFPYLGGAPKYRGRKPPQK